MILFHIDSLSLISITSSIPPHGQSPLLAPGHAIVAGDSWRDVCLVRTNVLVMRRRRGFHWSFYGSTRPHSHEIGKA